MNSCSTVLKLYVQRGYVSEDWRANVILCLLLNRRHLMPRQMIDNERSTAIHPGEAVEEKVSLSDRFGLWLGFHPCSQETYLAMVERYAAHFGLVIDPRICGGRRWNGPRRAAAGRAGWRGS